MGKLLTPATVFQTVANILSQLSQHIAALRQCDSGPYPFRDRAPTVALLRRGCWREKRTGANRPLRSLFGWLVLAFGSIPVLIVALLAAKGVL